MENITEITFNIEVASTSPADTNRRVLLSIPIRICGYNMMRFELKMFIVGGTHFWAQHKIITHLFRVKSYSFEAFIPIKLFRIRFAHNIYTKSYLFAKLTQFISGFLLGRDFPIWNNRLFLNNKSYLTQNDELIVKFRRWYNNFYIN